MKKEYISSSPGQTKSLGENFSKRILKKKLEKKAFVIGLEGELGGGKTTFSQGFAKGLGIKEKILSPTFVIYKKFQFNNLTPKKNQRFLTGQAIKQFNNFFHIDCYRIQKPKELLDLGFKEIISNPRNIIAIEWADKIKKIMPKDTIWIQFEFINEKKRKITVGV